MAPVLAGPERLGTPGLILSHGSAIVKPLLELALKHKLQSKFAGVLREALQGIGAPRSLHVPDTGAILTPREVEVVFRFVANYNNDTRWRQGVARMTQAPVDKTEVGTVTHEEKDLLGQRFVVVAKITAFEPDRRLDWASLESAIPVMGYRLVEPEGSGARFTLVIKGQLQGIYRWLAPLMIYTLRKEIAQDVVRLKAILEQGAL